MPNIIKVNKLQSVKTIVYFDQFETPKQEDIEALTNKGYSVISLNQVREAGRSNLNSLPKVDGETITTISYTSGTTGNPKGVMLSHNNLLSTLGGIDDGEISIYSNDVHLSYLPMAHIFERVFTYVFLIAGGQIGMYNGDVQKLKFDLLDLKPTIFCSVPRLYNRFYDLIKAQFDKITGLKKMLITRAIDKKLQNFKSYA